VQNVGGCGERKARRPAHEWNHVTLISCDF
jgi:hypothetical protein